MWLLTTGKQTSFEISHVAVIDKDIYGDTDCVLACMLAGRVKIRYVALAKVSNSCFSRNNLSLHSLNFLLKGDGLLESVATCRAEAGVDLRVCTFAASNFGTWGCVRKFSKKKTNLKKPRTAEVAGVVCSLTRYLANLPANSFRPESAPVY